MVRMRVFRSKTLVSGLIAAFLAVIWPVPAAAQAQAPAPAQQSYIRQGTLQGTVYSEGMRAM